MQISLGADDEAFLKKQVEDGRFLSIEDAVNDIFYIGLGFYISEQAPKVADADYLDYVNKAIQAGLDDIEAGRVISSEDFFAGLRSRRARVAEAA